MIMIISMSESFSFGVIFVFAFFRLGVSRMIHCWCVYKLDTRASNPNADIPISQKLMTEVKRFSKLHLYDFLAFLMKLLLRTWHTRTWYTNAVAENALRWWCCWHTDQKTKEKAKSDGDRGRCGASNLYSNNVKQILHKQAQQGIVRICACRSSND